MMARAPRGTRPRILFLLSVGSPSGAELATVTALRHVPADVATGAVLLTDGALVEELARLGVPAQALPPSGRSPRDRVRLALAVDRAVARLSPDLIHATGNKAAIFAVPASMRRRVPLVWQKSDLRYDGRGARLLARRCRRVIALSEAAAAVVPADRRTVIFPPVRLDPDFRVEPARPQATIGCVGRLEPSKGQHDVIIAAGQLREEFGDVRVLLAGAETAQARGYKERLLRLAAERGIGDRVEFLGHVSAIDEVLERLTVLVSASYDAPGGLGGEAFGIAVAEASWAGLPVVATRTGGLPEHVQDGVTGLLVPPRRPDELAAAIARILRDPEWARRLGDAGAAQARERSSPEVVAGRLFGVLRGCV